jgi:hypothetical protein
MNRIYESQLKFSIEADIGIEFLFAALLRRDLLETVVPTLVPNPGTPFVTQEHLPSRKSATTRALELSQVT